jgi:hypothetical protein
VWYAPGVLFAPLDYQKVIALTDMNSSGLILFLILIGNIPDWIGRAKFLINGIKKNYASRAALS